MVAEPIGCSGASSGGNSSQAVATAGGVNCSDYALVVLPRFAWFRQGAVKSDSAAGTIEMSAMGMPARTVATAVGESSVILLRPPLHLVC